MPRSAASVIRMTKQTATKIGRLNPSKLLSVCKVLP